MGYPVKTARPLVNRRGRAESLLVWSLRTSYAARGAPPPDTGVVTRNCCWNRFEQREGRIGRAVS